MAYQSIDNLQSALQNSMFSYSKDAKKAAGRALGTIVEIISYYLLRQWGLTQYISIERGLPEYGNSEITHNVEFGLHPLINSATLPETTPLPLTSTKLLSLINFTDSTDYLIKKTNTLLSKDYLLKNACLLAENSDSIISANLAGSDHLTPVVSHLLKSPFAMIECKRVGVEEGCKKGPQTIEKAKQGAYVAQKTSSLQKIRNDSGDLLGVIYKDGEPIIMEYQQLLTNIINTSDMLKHFTLSIGIVSNHGNWFTADNKNKELKVLAQSYDWLIFLTDNGLAQFISDLLLNPNSEYINVQKAFHESYKQNKKINMFTKSKINMAAHEDLCRYFAENINQIENWFNIIAPENQSISELKLTLNTLTSKDWRYFL